ncbi:hypothetical protein GCM10027280_52260 [Micromonospora polyrhachis]|uniref:DUF4132 domain-containing protein n=1 Tax=Micromonospora polyrhachis TaxID=1282883 RepID=A0A7W7SLW5_9ACTN|nr:DUF4132 domain-containing protein [Micromonospora polyrhachis]MBB4957193.1 hypothetical protein [Micromonospora polyrhachis]
MTHPRIPQALYDRVQALTDAGDVDEFVAGLVEIGELRSTDRDLRDLLGSAPADRWLAVYRRVAAARADQPRSPEDQLWRAVRETMPESAPTGVLREILEDIGQEFSYYPFEHLAELARAWLATGAELPVMLVGVLRRTAHTELTFDRSAPVLPALLSELTDLPPVDPGEVWADRVLADLPDLGVDWQRLLAHAGTATAAKPSDRWERHGRELLDVVGPNRAARIIEGWLRLVGQPRSIPLWQDYWWELGEYRYDPHNEIVLRGLIWLLGFTPADPDSARTLGELVPIALRRTPVTENLLSLPTAKAAVYALSRMTGLVAVEQLARLTHRVTVRSVRKDIDAAIDRQTAALGIPRAEAEETGIPSYGFVEVGRRVLSIGGVTATLTVSGVRVVLAWRDTAGNLLKAPPPAVRRGHADEMGRLRSQTRRIDQALAAQVDRLAREMTAGRAWRYDRWCEHYLDHPLVGVLARGLIWTVDGQSCGYADGALRGLDDAPPTPAPDAPVRLWHPAHHTEDEVAAWRSWLHRHDIGQPVAQVDLPVVRPV